MKRNYFKTSVLLVWALIIFISADKAKPRILIIGDSISIGYTPFLLEAMKDEAIVIHNNGNAQHTGTGLKKIEEWLGDENWDIIQFNFGLWDLCYRNPESKNQGNRDKINGKITFTPEQYRCNLDSIVQRLLKTKAKLIFVTTTYIPVNEAGRKMGDDDIYNKVALEVMAKYNVMVNDLNPLSRNVHLTQGIGTDDVHYTKEGYKQLSVQIISVLRDVMKSIIVSSKSIQTKTDKPTPESVFEVMKGVAEWQMKEPLRHKLYDWTNGALYTGIMAFGRIANSDVYFNWMRKISDSIKWKTGPRRFMADDYCVGQLFCELYDIYKVPKMIEYFKNQADDIITAPHIESLAWKNKIHNREWAWCDALFMGPPALAELYMVTGEIKYLDIMNKLWWKTTEYLYNTTDSLYFRDSTFFTKKEKNGTNVYWSRGNGWVMGGLVRVLNIMPKDYPDYPRYVKLYKEMSQKIARLQQSDGTWHASLLDPDSYPVKETSGTGFYCFALSWGINQGILEREKYLPVVFRAWNTLASCVQPNGKLGYVQRIGASPDGVTSDDTEVYGVGAFLLAGNEIINLLFNEQTETPKIMLEGNYISLKTNIIKVNADSLISKNPILQNRFIKSGEIIKISPSNLEFVDFITGRKLKYKLQKDKKTKSNTFVFKANIPQGNVLFLKIYVK